MDVRRDRYVPMRDGVRLSLDVYGTTGGGARPSVLIRIPYVKGLSSSGIMTASPWAALTADGLSAAAVMGQRAATADSLEVIVGRLVREGYVVVVSDTRGTGYSEGAYDYYNMSGGPWDGYDTVEWMAAQPWSDGKVGLWGVSASGVLAYLTAITRPPHLAALVANLCPADFYHDQWYPGGLYRLEDRMRWVMGMQSTTAPLDPGPPGAPGYQDKRAVYESRYVNHFERMRRGLSPVDLDWATEYTTHDTYDEFWRSRSLVPRLADVGVPTLNVGVLFDHFISGTLSYHKGLDVPRRLAITPGALDVTGTAGDGGIPDVTVAWFDHFLRGRTSDVADNPPVRTFLTGVDSWSDLGSWPRAGGQPSEVLFLSDGLALSREPGGAASASLVHDPGNPHRTARDTADQRSFEDGAITFTTATLGADLAVVGSPRLEVLAESAAADFDICARLVDVAPNGRTRLVQVSGRRASHRESHTSPTPVAAGETVRIPVVFRGVTHVFQRGHRIRLVIAAADHPFFAPSPIPATIRIALGEHGSRISLPLG